MRQKAIEAVKAKILGTARTTANAKKIRELYIELRQLKSGNKPFVLKQFKKPLAVGQSAPMYQCAITQVIDGKNMLATVTIAGYGRAHYYTGSSANVDPRSVGHGHVDPGEVLVWISGVNTQGLVNGATHRLGQVFGITGTKQYPNPVGSTNTVFVLEPMD